MIQAQPNPRRGDISAIKLTPEEQFLYQMHLDNLAKGGVKNADGSVSTLHQISIMGPDGRTYNIPTVWGGKILPVRGAVEKVDELGWENFPAYPNPDIAEQRYRQMHDYIARDLGP